MARNCLDKSSLRTVFSPNLQPTSFKVKCPNSCFRSHLNCPRSCSGSHLTFELMSQNKSPSRTLTRRSRQAKQCSNVPLPDSSYSHSRRFHSLQTLTGLQVILSKSEWRDPLRNPAARDDK